MSTSVNEIVTNRIIEELEKGNIPWQRPWSTAGRYAMSHSTKKPYSLLNQMLLRPGEYLTFEECKREGGKVKKGEKGNFVVSWAKIKKVETDEEGNERTTIIPRLKYYYVFEVSQCEGIERNCTEEPKTYGNTPVESADNIITAYINRETVTFTATDSNRAYYSPSEDAVVVPDLKYFEAVEEYYSTSFHELTHSTMHQDRCNRAEERKGKKVAFGSEEYSKEEQNNDRPKISLGSTFTKHIGSVGLVTSLENQFSPIIGYQIYFCHSFNLFLMLIIIKII